MRELLEEAGGGDSQVAEVIRAHLAVDVAELPVHGEQLAAFELANVQLAIDAILERPGVEGRVVGLAGPGWRFSDVSLADLLTQSTIRPGPPVFMHVPVGPNRTLPCLAFALLLVTSPEGPLAVFVRQGYEHSAMPGLLVQAVARDPDVASRFLAELRRLMDERNVFRGQVITLEVTQHGSQKVVFLERPQLSAHELVLPDGLLERVEQHVVAPSRHREELLARGRHLARGLLIWGPPGTGKTHTVRYLAGLVSDATVVILSGLSLGLVGAFGNLARRLAPAVVILEDVDLIAQERAYGPFGSSNPLLFELMNEMSGLAEDADIAFVLTTNRPDALEPALAARPGRVDLAVEIPLPDASARRRLLELYAHGLTLDGVDLDDVVSRTEGMTASFFRELLRKAALASVASERSSVTSADVDRALDELLHETAALTRVLLGGGAPGWTASPSAHAWLEAMPPGSSE